MDYEILESQIDFDSNFSSNDYILMEVDEQIANELISSESLYVRGYKTDEMVICTENTTNICKEKAIMNSLMLLDGVNNFTKVLALSNSFYEINRTTPNMISRIKQIFSKQEIDIFEDSSTGQIKGISWASLLSQLQMSEDELKNELDKFPVFENNGKLYSINKRTIWKLLDFITEICCEGQIAMDRLDHEILRAKLLKKIPDNLIAWFIRIFCVKNDAGFYNLNESEFSRARAEQILICSDHEQFNYNEFEERVNKMLPDNFTFNAEIHLNGLALIDNSQFYGKTIRKLLISELPVDLHKRLSILFSLKNSWTKEEIQPYILEYCPNQTKIDAFLLSHCRIMGDASNRSYQPIMNNINSLIRKIAEFYATGSKELSTALEDFRQDVNAWKVAIELIDLSNTSMNVQFYGAEVLYFTISKKFDTISESFENVNYLKDFLIRKISNSAHSLPHSVLNKLISSLALFALKSMPDIWTDPLKELMIIWANQLELLLTILSEIPMEFKRLNLSIDHRNIVKTNLQNTTKEILQLVHNALEDTDSTGSLRNAAFECVESWLKLPDAKLLDFIPIFNIVFANINNDFATLARIIGTLKSNDELQNYPQIIWQIVQVIIKDVCPLIQSELNTIFMERGAHNERMEDLVPVISTIVEFTREFAKIIVDNASKNIQHQPIIEVYSLLCQFFLRISTLPGIYPIQECLSDLPEPWWISLTEELLQIEPGDEGKKQLKLQSILWFIQILEVAITKFTHNSEMDLLNKDELERFESYRLERSNVSLNAIQIAPNETMALFSNNLHNALNNFDANRSEAILFLIKESSDFIKQSQLNYLLPAIIKCGTLEEWAVTNINQIVLIRFARTFLLFINSIEHHMVSSDKAQQAIPLIVQIILSYLQLPELTKSAFESLIKFMKNRESIAKLNIDQIIQSSYNYFINSNQPKEIRLLAIRCVSMGLSFKESETIIKSLNQILVPRFAQLENFIALQKTNFDEQIMEEINFELSVLAQILATLETPKQSNGIQTNSEGPVKMILNKTLPLFNDLLSNHQPANELVLRVCEVLKAGIQSLYTDISPLLDNYLNFLDAIIELFPEAACDLAKKIYLTFHKETSIETPKLVNHLAKWFSVHSMALSSPQNECYEKLVDFGHFIIKKFWNCLIFSTKFSEQSAYDVANFIQSFFIIIASVIEQSKDTSLIQETLRTLNLALKNIKNEDNEVFTNSLKIVAERITTVLFMCIQSESTLITSLNLIADTLYNLAEKYPAETRNIIHNLPCGNSQLVFSMFSMHTIKNYRMRVLQMHQDAASIQSAYGK